MAAAVMRLKEQSVVGFVFGFDRSRSTSDVSFILGKIRAFLLHLKDMFSLFYPKENTHDYDADG